MIFAFLLRVLLTLVSLLLLPIDAIINALIPNFTTLTGYIVNFFDLVLTYIGNALSLLGINAIIVSMVVAFWTFKLTAPITVWLLKLIFKWWHAVKG